ncbi:MAG: alpha/beta fold hydrolase [Frankiaceae bacterium]
MTTTTTLPRAAVRSDTATAVVKEYTTPAVVNLRPEENLTDIVFGNAAESPKLVSLSRKDGSSWTDVTARQFADQVTALAKGLIAAGISPGDRIGLLSKTRYEWTLADFAILTAGAVVVPIYETSAADQVAWCLRDSEAVAVVVETAAHAETVDELAGALPNLRHIWQIDAGDLDTLADDGESVPDSEVTERRAALNGDTLATIIYTSGTTGRPKGCELTHRNFLFDALTCTAAMSEIFTEGTSTLLFLPLAHVLGRVIQYVALSAKVRLGHTGDMKDLLPDLAAFQPTFVLSVPRVFEKIYNGAKIKADAGGKGRLFNLAESVAVSYSEALDRGRPNVVVRQFATEIDALYTSPRGPEPGLTNGSTAWLNARGAAHIPKTRNVPNPTTTIARPNGDDTTLLPGAEPYLADGGPVGALLIHGYTGCPQSMRPWAEHLATAGYTVSLPRLPGHGTRWQDLQQTRWPDWYGEVDNAFSALRARCDQVFVMGLSMGGTLSLRLAEERPDEIAGLVLVNPSIMMKDPRLIVLPILRRFLTTLPGIASDIKKPGVTELAYDRNPPQALSSLTDLWRTVRADLGKVTAPILILRSTDDHLVKPVNSQTLRNELRCPLQELLLNNSYHVATLDNDAPTIFASSVEFATAHTTPVRT